MVMPSQSHTATSPFRIILAATDYAGANAGGHAVPIGMAHNALSVSKTSEDEPSHACGLIWGPAIA
jgi:hypothetical protein